MLLSDQITFKLTKIMRLNNKHYILAKVSIHQKDLTHQYICTKEAEKYRKQLLIDMRYINSHIIVMEDFKVH